MVLFGFLIYHLYLISKNTTTNETYKWSDYNHYIHQFRKLEKEYEIQKENNQTKSIQQRKTKQQQQKIDIQKDFHNFTIPPIYKIDKKGKIIVKNIYNKGIINNFWEILFPNSF